MSDDGIRRADIRGDERREAERRGDGMEGDEMGGFRDSK